MKVSPCKICGSKTNLIGIFESNEDHPVKSICLEHFIGQCSNMVKEEAKQKIEELFQGEAFLKLTDKFAQRFKNLDYTEFGEKIWIEIEPNIIKLIELQITEMMR